MRTRNKHATSTVAAFAWALVSGAAAFADDTEVFFADPSTVAAQPNILFILDNSESMDDRVEPEASVAAATTYGAAADGEPTGPQKKIDVVKAVATRVLNALDGVNVGLMVYNSEEGGNVRHALADVAAARPSIAAAIDDVELAMFTPLSETLYESYLYLRGAGIELGKIGPVQSVDGSRTAAGGDTYKTPLEAGCQKNFIVYLSDGLATRDHGADAKIESLIGGACDGDGGDGYCLDDLAAYMRNNDIADSVAGVQTAITYAIGFDLDVPILREAATDGGGLYFTANDSASLTTALKAILLDVSQTSSTFASPAVSVNGFNRTRHLNDLYVGVFTATSDTHWPGNLKKYRLRPADGAIVDSTTPTALLAVDSSGFLATGTKSFWSAAPDGPNVAMGGAASNMPLPAARAVYTYLAGPDLTAAGNQVVLANAAIDDALLHTGAAGGPTRAQVIDFIRGTDPKTGAPRRQMGDPLHSRPAAVTYSAAKTLVYFATNDGYLHAVDAANGTEAWAFIPPEFMDDQVDLYRDRPAGTRHYGIDGSPRVQRVADNDGVIGPGEKVYLYFGMRRGGDFYYGLDVTDPAHPRVLWRLPGSGAHALPGMGQSWSNPAPARMNISGTTQNPNKLVLVFGAGYDTKHDEDAITGIDTVGKAIFIVDSVSGDVLWSGAASGGTASFAKMGYSIPGDIRVVDLNGDGYGDRMYAADLGGQVWRFDLFNGRTAAAFVTGGVIAQLGGAPSLSPAVADTRRFYDSPDVALVSGDTSYIHVGIGSGHREHPNSLLNQDRFYALRDYHAFAQLTQAQYDAAVPIKDADLVDVTTDVSAAIPPAGPGWKLRLTHAGEKVLAEGRTFDDQVFFTSYTPDADADRTTTDCRPSLGTNRLYTVSVRNGAPVNDLDASASTDPPAADDRYREFNGSLASEVVFIFPSPESDCAGDDCTPPPVACVDLFCFPPGFADNPIRTFWSEKSVD